MTDFYKLFSSNQKHAYKNITHTPYAFPKYGAHSLFGTFD